MAMTPITKPSWQRTADRIQKWYHALVPRIAIHLTDPNVVLTLADARGQTEIYLTDIRPGDTDAITALSKISEPNGIRFRTESYISGTTGKPAYMVDVESLAGYQLVAAATKLPGIPKFDPSTSWKGIDPWQRAAVAGVLAAAKKGEYPPEIFEESKDRHAVMGVMKGYPDEAIMSIVKEKPPIGDLPVTYISTHVPYADYYYCAQPGYTYDPADEAIIAPHVAAWGRLLEDYYKSPEHARLAANPTFQEERRRDKYE